MKKITNRNIPDGVNKTVQKKRGLYHDLDHLAGIWSREEAASFDKSLKAQRKMDKSCTARCAFDSADKSRPAGFPHARE